MIDWRYAMRSGMEAMERVMAEDIVARLKKMLPKIGTCESDINTVAVATIQDALVEIQQLRAKIEAISQVAGKASIDGVSFAQIKARRPDSDVLGKFTGETNGE